MPRIRTGTFSASVRKRVEFRVCPRISARGAPLLRAGAGSRAARDVFLSLGKNPDRRPAASLPTTRTCSCSRCGGGAGAYAFPLAEQGYSVHLIDPVPLHIEQAKQRAETAPAAPKDFQVGDARSLSINDATADAVLLFGPLYHLTERRDRLTALREAHRVLHPGGTLFAVAISRFASALDGIGRGRMRDPKFAQIVEQDLKTGQHRNETEEFEYFTTAFFHHPDEFLEELKEGEFSDVTLRSIEGPLWAPPEPLTPEERDRLMTIMRTIETEPTLIGSSAHIMAIARKS